MEKKIGSLSLRDLLHGLFVTVFGAVFTVIIQLIQNNGFSLTKQDGLQVLSVAVIAGLSYLSKKLFSDEKGNLGGKF